MSHDPMEWTVRDPLEETVPDPVVRRRRMSDGRRRAIELIAVVVLVPSLLAAEWVDNRHQSRGYQTHERVTVVPRGGTGTLGHIRLRLLGRDATGSPKSDIAGAVAVKLVVQARPLDATAVKGVGTLGFTVRDQAGHVWSAFGSTDRDNAPAVGAVAQVTVTADVPAHLVSSVVLEARPGGLVASRGAAPTQVLRFAH
ncbi:hypothetical protein [Actinomadura sp. DC4]|uniref:hypothetical protein n=1 Tax=Actinomadura sp. DC4 TaxID=3055069 RepID=UPI0025B10F53|nr:hypothetical protein [Actinomadura sp. DC4]MDN3359940.1 hypothetical protein [Actinomadura sp. DC4]